jgi:hypothetical protein
MRKITKPSDFDFEYTGSVLTEKEAIERKHTQLTGEELQSRISNKTVYGDYLMGYKYVSELYEDGTTEGVNNVGARDLGTWAIDMENHTLTTKWKYGWFDTITRAYDVGGNIEFFDVETGNWRTSFKKIEELTD